MPSPRSTSRVKRSAAGVMLTAWLLTLGTAQVLAVEPINTTIFGKVAIKGYDPVAYFSEARPVKGSKQHSTEWMDATWRFISAENLQAFTAEPQRYAPQYGGYCAWAVSQGDTADIDPEAWRIVEGKLYLNYNKEIQARWEADIEGHIEAADEQWPRLLER